MVTTTHRPPIEEQLAAMRRGSEKILPDEAALRALMERAEAEDRPLRVKLGIDPTTHDLTLGHTIPLRNLRRFQDIGHQAVLVIGDYTATVGDPSGRSKARPPLTHEQVRANAETYREQAGKIIDLKRAEVVWNSEWLSKLTLQELIRIGSTISIKQMLEGEYFGRRFQDSKQTIFLHEFLYPVMQGMDSVNVRADIEIGGSDQEFNCLMGRQMQRMYKQDEQIVVTSPLIKGLVGDEKMSKSAGNYVGVAWPTQEQFNKLMTMSDERIPEYFQLLTDSSPKKVIDDYLSTVKRIAGNLQSLPLATEDWKAQLEKLFGEVRATQNQLMATAAPPDQLLTKWLDNTKRAERLLRETLSQYPAPQGSIPWQTIAASVGPVAAKKEVVEEIVSQLNGPEEAAFVATQYERYAQLRRAGGAESALPTNIREETVSVGPEGVRLGTVLTATGLAGSGGEAKRLIEQRGVRVRGEVVADKNATLRPGEVEGALLQVGQKPPILLREAP